MTSDQYDAGLKERLREVTGVLSVESNVLDGDGEEVHSFSVETELKQDIRGQLARSVIESGFELVELRSMELSLEDVFTQLTTQEEVRSQ